MRKIVLMSALFYAVAMYAQDVIVKKDGSTILAKVTKVSDKEVEYKKYKSNSDRLYSISIPEVMAINYEDGEKETFDNVSKEEKPQNTNSEEQQSIIQITPDKLSANAKAANDVLIARYNAPVEITIEEKQKKKVGVKEASYAKAIYGVKSNSVLSNDELEINILLGTLSKYKKNDPYKWHKGHCLYNPAILLKIHNKSNKMLYIDLGNTFFVSMGNAFCYYVPTSTTTTNSSSNGGSVNLGSIAGALGVGGVAGTLASGINVGGGSSSSTTSTTYAQRIMALPPMSYVDLPAQFMFEIREISKGVISMYREISKGLLSMYNKGIEKYMYYTEVNFPKNSEKGPMKFGDRYFYTEEQSPVNFSCVVSYSFAENCSSLNSMTSNLYLKELIGDDFSSNNIIIDTNNILYNKFSVYSKGDEEFPRY